MRALSEILRIRGVLQDCGRLQRPQCVLKDHVAGIASERARKVLRPESRASPIRRRHEDDGLCLT